MIKIIDLYIIKSLIKPFVAGVSAFIIIMLANSLFLYAEMIIKSGLPSGSVISLLLYSLPAMIVVTFPVGFLFATLLTLGRFSKDVELTALRSCGISYNRILFPIFAISLIISGLGFFLNDNIVPYSNSESKSTYIDMINNQKLPLIKEKVFSKADDSNRSYFVNKSNKEKESLEGVFIFDSQEDGFPQIIEAEEAKRNEENQKMVLKNGLLTKHKNNGYIAHQIDFSEMEIDFKISDDYINNNKSMQELPANEAKKILDDYKKKHPKNKSKINKMEIDYYMKFSLPLATFFVALIAAPIGIKFAKMGTYYGVAISIALVFFWYLTFSICSSLGSKGVIPTLLAAWIQNIIFGISGLILFLKIKDK